MSLALASATVCFGQAARAQIKDDRLAEFRARSEAATKELRQKMENASAEARARTEALPKGYLEALAENRTLPQGKLGVALSSGGGGGMMMLLSSGCPTNGPVYITNMTATLTTNAGATVTFDIVGGTNGVLYDIFVTTNLHGSSVTNSDWVWLARDTTCTSHT